MASDSKQYETALQTWHNLHNDQEYSVSPYIGTTAILYTQAVHDSRLFEVENEDAELVRERELKIYEREAYVIADKLQNRHQRVEVIEAPTKHDFYNVLCDPQVVSIVTIGSGSLQSLILDVDENDEIYHSVTWRDVAKSMTHLKLGYFEQRQCGHVMPHCAAVPLGVFAMAAFSRVKAAAGQYFTPDAPYGDNEKIRTVTSKNFLTYTEIRDLCKKLHGDPSSLDPDEEIDN